MIGNLSSYFLPKVQYEDSLTQQRASSLLVFLGASIALTLISAVISVFSIASGSVDGSFTPNIGEITSLVTPIFLVLAFFGIRYGYYYRTAIAIVVFTIIPLLNYWSTSLNTVDVLVFALPIVTAGVLLGRQASLVAYAVTIGLGAGPTLINNNAAGDFSSLFVIVSIIMVLVFILLGDIDSIAKRFIEELRKLQAVNEATLKSSQEDDETRMILSTINIIRDELGYSFARLYLVEGNEIVQRVQTSLNLSEMTVDSNISISNRSGIYDAIRTKDTIVIRVTDLDVTRQHLLSGTRGALAVPVLDKLDNVIAVIDAQSENFGDFSEPELQTIRLVANQLGQNLQQLRLIANLRENLAEQSEIVARQRQRLLQYERTERQTTTEAWHDYLQERGTDFMGYDMELGATSPMEAIEMDDDLKTAIQTGDIHVQEDGDYQIVSVPISLRGQSLGAMTFRVPAGSQVGGARQQELIQNVVQRLSLALENKRLFEQSQSQAIRERTANEVGNLLLSSTDIDTVLNLAASNFNQALGAIQTQIRLKPEIRNLGESEVSS